MNKILVEVSIGELLDKMLLSINLNRDNVYITNVVNYRPPENRNPTKEEIAKYLPYLNKHIEIIDPKISTIQNFIKHNMRTK